MELLDAVIGIAGAILGGVLAYVAFLRNSKKDGGSNSGSTPPALRTHTTAAK